MPNPAWHPQLYQWQRRVRWLYVPDNSVIAHPNRLVVPADVLAEMQDGQAESRVVNHNVNPPIILPRENDQGSMWAKHDLVADNALELWTYYKNPTGTEMTAAERQATWNANHVGVWHLGDAGPTTALDSTVNANHGTQGGGATFGAAGQIGKCIGFDGDNDLINCGTGATLNPAEQLTLEAWVYYNGGETGPRIFDRTTANYTYLFLFTGTADPQAVRFYLKFSDDTTSQFLSNSTQAKGTWAHWAATYDGTTMRIYKNGIVDTNSLTVSKAPKQGSASLILGNDSEGTRSLLGSMDEVRVSNVGLTAQWIAEDVAQQSAAVGEWLERQTKPTFVSFYGGRYGWPFGGKYGRI